jgi:hypothetical protein
MTPQHDDGAHAEPDKDSPVPQRQVAHTLTCSLAEAAAAIPCTERWVADGLRAGRFPGRKIVNQWRLTDEDIAAVLEASKPEPPPPVSIVDGLSPAARRRIQRRVNK